MGDLPGFVQLLIGLAGSIALLFAGRVMFRGAVVSQANQVVNLLRSQVEALEDEIGKLKAENAELRTELSVLRDQVTGATAIERLREHLDVRLDDIQMQLRG